MQIGILGTGQVARALGDGFIALGRDVKIGGRAAGSEHARAWVEKQGKKASEGTFADAARFGEIVILATAGTANEAAVRAASLDAFRGKVVIDVTNPLEFSTGKPRLSVGHTDSGGEQLQRLLPEARVVKAWNTVGNTLMFKPNLAGGPPDMPICGEDEAAKKTVANILQEFGWGVLDLGGIESSRYLEAMCMAWVVYGARHNTWNHAWKLLRA